MKSVRQAALVWTTVLLTAVGVIAFLIAFETARLQAGEFLDGQLRQIALNAGNGVAESPAPEADQDPDDNFVINVWNNADGSLRNAAGVVLPQQRQAGFGMIEAGGRSWRVYLARDAQRTIQVGQRLDVRNDIAETSGVEAGIPILATIPLAWLVIGLSLNKVLEPLASLARLIGERGPDSHEPIPTKDVPLELLPVFHAMNGLADRLRAAVEQQKRFVSDAAHELRTPLAALRIQVDNMIAETGAQPSSSTDEIASGFDRASLLIQQLLRMARLDSLETQTPDKSVNLSALASECVAALVPLAEAKGVDLGLTAQDAATIAGNPNDLKLLFTNLIDNAVRYTPAGGSVDVSVTRGGPFAILEILDTGPGVSEEDLPRLCGRFFRGAGVEGEGSGLGLAIAQAVAKRNGLQLDLNNRADGHGFRAAVMALETSKKRLIRP